MQRSIASFFQPKTKDKDTPKKTAEKTVKKPVKTPLKAQNGVQEADSPVKKVSKRSRQILDSDDDEAPAVKEPAATKGKADKEAPGKTEKKDDVFKAVPTPLSPPPAPATPVTPVTPATPASSASPGTPDTPNSVSPSGIVKRKTARKMFPKRKLDESRSGSEGQREEAEAAEEQGHQNKRPRVETGAEESTEEPMEEGEKEERAEKALTEANGQDEEVEEKKSAKGEADEEENKGSEEEEKKAEEAEKKSEAREKTDDDKGLSVTKEEVVEKDTGDGRESPKSQMFEKKPREAQEQKDKEPAKKASISSFFAPRKAAVKKENPKRSDGEERTSPEKKKSEEEECKDIKGESTSGQTCYDPSRPNYHPVDHACWKQGQKVPYLAVARTFEKIEEDSGRLRNIETLSNLFRSVLLLSPATQAAGCQPLYQGDDEARLHIKGGRTPLFGVCGGAGT
ncbi:DNA ligase 1-like [Menidia menidia]